MQLFKRTHFDFLRWRWHAIAMSWVVILAGLVTIWTRGIPKGVEFAGGTVVIEQFEQAVSVEQVRTALDRNYSASGQNTVVQSYGAPSEHLVMIRVPQVGAESGASLSTTAQQVEEALRKGNVGTFRRQGAQIVSATVGRELESKGLWATALSLIGILAYLAFRFQFSFGVGAVVATIHDLLITFAFLSFFQYDLTLNVIAAILTMTGYSTNDTIVIFDRISARTCASMRPRLDEPAIINLLGQSRHWAGPSSRRARRCSRRSPLFFFGGEVLHGFRLHDGGRHHHRQPTRASSSPPRSSSLRYGSGPTRAAAHAPAPATAPPQPARRSKPQRKARAS